MHVFHTEHLPTYLNKNNTIQISGMTADLMPVTFFVSEPMDQLTQFVVVNEQLSMGGHIDGFLFVEEPKFHAASLRKFIGGDTITLPSLEAMLILNEKSIDVFSLNDSKTPLLIVQLDDDFDVYSWATIWSTLCKKR